MFSPADAPPVKPATATTVNRTAQHRMIASTFSRPRHYSPVEAGQECTCAKVAYAAKSLTPSGCSRASPPSRAPSRPSGA
jgi:hypothetical protein